MPELTRELFVGLGGTGGEALTLLYNQMNEVQRQTAKYVYIDTNQKDIDRLIVNGIRSIAISNADVVRQVRDSLGADDGVLDWLPDNRTFLASRLDDGASQCRFKSRLCLARFLKNGAPGLQELLEEMTRPGIATENNRLRVVIVSSIAGGTGAGTFIQMALYIRKFFRNLNQQAEIIGILSCPDLYVGFAENETEEHSMFANAYAAIRELNAMNLATNLSDAENPANTKASNHLRGYGSKIGLQIRTNSEGTLFDAKDRAFQTDVSAKPFDLIYFVDKANERGGILSDIHEYYRIMADIAYTRLYSPMNSAIASGESNEMHNHIMVPTAIYGGAGYARILYPYQDILRYLAEQNLYDELDHQWLYLDSLWDIESETEQDAARTAGGRWTPKPGQRGRKYQDDLDTELDDRDSREKSRFSFLRNMVYDEGDVSKVYAFTAAINEAATSLRVKKDEQGVVEFPTDEDVLRSSGGKHSVLRDSDVVEAIAGLMKKVASAQASQEGSEKPFSPLLDLAAEVENNWGTLETALVDAAKSQAQRLATAILPLTEVSLRNHDKTSPISLHYALLSRDGIGDVHPMAARYLLYGFQELCLEHQSSDALEDLRTALNRSLRKIRLALDDNTDDDEDITVSMVVEENEDRRMLRKNRDALAREMLSDFCKELKANLAQALLEADKAVVQGAYSELLGPVNELVSLYEGFFRTIAPYRDELKQMINADLNRHDRGVNQTIYVGASSRVKKVYTVDPSVLNALSSDPDATYAAVGAGVFESLYQRLTLRLKEEALARKLGEAAPAASQEQFSDMGQIFQGILAKYMDLLDRNETLLKTNAVGAVINEICADLGISKGDIGHNAAATELFDQAFRDRMDDLRAKARPMIRYNDKNSITYYTEEATDKLLNESKRYCCFGFSPASADVIARYYPTDAKDPMTVFHSRMRMDKYYSLLTSPEYNDNEIFCFSAVHCLQPTQIYHFLEGQGEDSYYSHYLDRVGSEDPSENPHLDKRWKQRGVMPYISPSLELQWRRVVIKALIYEALHGTLSFTVDRSNAKCFIRQEEDAIKFLYWPKGQQILTRNISRLVEYLAEDEATVEDEAARLDTNVERYARSLSNYAETPGLYKQGMTKDKLLSLLRMDMLTFLQTDKSIRAGTVLSDENETISVELEKSLGGILHIAYLLHQSEERLGEDKDYGEAMLEAAAEIVDRYALGMHGASHIEGNSALHKEYVEIYNWAAEKFLSDWLTRAKIEYRAEVEPADSAETAERPVGSNRLQDLDEPVMTTKTSHDDVPERIRRTSEYIWITNNWKYKSFEEG